MRSAEKISFESGGAFMRETRREVEPYLARASHRRATINLHAKVPIAIGLIVVSWALLLLARHDPCDAALFLALVAGAILTGFCVQHDANHSASFRSTRYNHLLGWSSDALLGIAAMPGASGTTSRTTRTRTSTATTTISRRCRSHGSSRRRPHGRGIASSTTTSGRSIASWGFGCSRSAISTPSCAAASAARRCARRAAGISPGSSREGDLLRLGAAVPLLFFPWWLVLPASSACR